MVNHSSFSRINGLIAQLTSKGAQLNFRLVSRLLGDNNISLTHFEQASAPFQLKFPSNQVSTFKLPSSSRAILGHCAASGIRKQLPTANLISLLSWISILTSFSVFTVSLKNYISLKLAALPFPIIIGDPPSGSRNVPIFFKPIAAPPPFGLTSLETKLTINP
ncbi:MAG: hypothetical protein ACTS5R_02360 [Candidatus Hodgkinia cicadicola]